MKKFAYISMAAIAATFAVSCNKELDSPVGNDDGSLVTFTATTAQTKTELLDGHTVWSMNDQITVLYNGGSVTADIKTGEGTSKATFQAAVPASTDYYAVYPAAAASSLSGGNLTVTIPQVQKGDFGSSHIAVAKGADKAFAFANVNAFLKITIPAGYKRIVVESPGGMPLSGSIQASFQGSEVALALGSDGVPSVEIASETAFPAGDVYISVLPGVTHGKGLLLKYYDGTDIKGTFYLDKEIVTEASVIHSFGEFGVTGDFYATLEGAGNKTGINPSNAMDLPALKALLSMPEDAGKLAALAAALDGATIHMGPGTWDFQDSIALVFPDVADKVAVSIEGDTGSRTIITGNESHRLLNLGANAKASFKNISFTKGLAKLSGNAPLLIKDGAEASFTNCSFSGCTNKKADGSYATGGCIYADTGTILTFDNCEFSSNKASYASTLLVKGKATIRDSHFQYNDGTWPGSALYLDHEDAECEVYDSIIEDNTVTANSGEKPDGGAIAVVHGKLTMNGCSLQRNSIPGRRGGALRVASSDSYAKLINCTVKGNNADWGGAINVPAGTLEIQGGTFEENYAKGGGCILASASGIVRIKDALFKNNYLPKAGRFGGAIRHESSQELTILNTVFDGNYSEYNGEDEAFGGAVSVAYDQEDAQVTIDGCSFIGNHTKSGGGTALCYQSHGSGGSGWMKVSNTVFKDNYNEYTGTNNNNYARHAGAVRLGHDSTNSYFDNCLFENNYTQTASSEVKSCYGGAVTFYSDGMGHFNNCHFENNRATRGGAISVWNCTISGIYLNGCSFSKNWISYKSGTDIYFEKSKYFCMNNCAFSDDTYTMSNEENDGCWVYASGDADKVMEECVISNCSLIGSARTTSALDPLSGQELIYLRNAKSDKHYYLINNIVVAGNGQYSWRINQAGTSNTYGYYNVYTTKDGTSAYTGSGDTDNKAASDLGNLAWDPTGHVWSWNGTVAGGGTRITASAFSTALTTASPDFKAWLTEAGVLNKDRLGNDRGSGEWWPGAYQQ